MKPAEYWGIKADGPFCLIDRGKEVEAAAEDLVSSVPHAAARMIIHLDMRLNEAEQKINELIDGINLRK